MGNDPDSRYLGFDNELCRVISHFLKKSSSRLPLRCESRFGFFEKRWDYLQNASPGGKLAPPQTVTDEECGKKPKIQYNITDLLPGGIPCLAQE